jgi:hypothetical protein
LFDIFGFSRAAAAARHFANRVQAEEHAIINAISTGMRKFNYRGAPAGIPLSRHNGHRGGSRHSSKRTQSAQRRYRQR